MEKAVGNSDHETISVVAVRIRWKDFALPDSCLTVLSSIKITNILTRQVMLTSTNTCVALSSCDWAMCRMRCGSAVIINTQIVNRYSHASTFQLTIILSSWDRGAANSGSKK